MQNLALLNEEIKKELSIDEDGKAFATQTAIAKLCGVTKQSISLLIEQIALQPTSKINSEALQSLLGMDLRATSKIPDTAIVPILFHYAMYARKTTLQAKALCFAFAAIGFRTWIQQELGWKPKEIRYTRQGKNLWRDERTGQWYIQHYNEFKEINHADAQRLQKQLVQRTQDVENLTAMLSEMLLQRRLEAS